MIKSNYQIVTLRQLPEKWLICVEISILSKDSEPESQINNWRLAFGKIYEEYIRGSLDELVNLDPSSLIGEFVIVIEGNNATSNQYDDEKIIQMAKLILDEGISKSTCCKIIVNLTNLKKNYIYDLINKL